MRYLLLALALICCASPASAQTRAVSAERGLVQLDYAPDRIFALRGHLGYQMMIEFNADERIENVSIGDSLVWQVTPNRAASILFLKPLQRRAATNMNVVTNRRVYSFQLSATAPASANDPNIIYRVSFRYPAEETAAQPAVAPTPPTYNFHYATTGAAQIAPARVFDDGQSTYFEFPPNADVPAIFVLDGEQEEIANAQARGEFIVIDRVASAFALRFGRRRAVVQNQAFPAEAPR
jgi:type IV secretion system protein VirB9